MGIENWRDHSTLVAGKEIVDAERDKELLMEAKVAAAAMSYKHVDDDSADKSVCAAIVISCMSSYASISSNATATSEQELRKVFTAARIQRANTNAALQKLQHEMEAGKRARSKAFLANWESSGGANLLNLITSACLPGKKEEAAVEDLRRHAEDAERRNLLQTYRDNLSVVPDDILLTKTQGVCLKALRDGAAAGQFK